MTTIFVCDCDEGDDVESEREQWLSLKQPLALPHNLEAGRSPQAQTRRSERLELVEVGRGMLALSGSVRQEQGNRATEHAQTLKSAYTYSVSASGSSINPVAGEGEGDEIPSFEPGSSTVSSAQADNLIAQLE